MVRRRILEDPSVTNDVLFAAATEMEPDLQGLSMRQFNARYPLRVRRWELSERTRILHPTGPLSKAAAENPAAPVPPPPELLVSEMEDADGSTAAHADHAAPPSETQTGAAQSDTRVAAGPGVEASILEARVDPPEVADEPLSPAGAPASTVSQTSTSRLEPHPGALGDSTEAESQTSAPALAAKPVAPARTRRGRARRRSVDDPRAEVMTVMLRWATAIGGARGIPEVFATLSTVDDYVDHIANVLDIP